MEDMVMKKWNKQILSVLLALAMCLGMFPVSVFAEGDDQTVQEPAFTSVTESVVVKPTDETAAIEASVNFAAPYFAVFRRPFGETEAGWEQILVGNALTPGSYRHVLPAAAGWEHYDYMIRAYLPGELAQETGREYIDSEPIEVQFEGYKVVFDKNEGSDAFDCSWVGHGYRLPDAYPMEDMLVAPGETCTVPECTIIPPDWMMFDHWVMIFPDGHQETMSEGDTFTITGNSTLKPIWTNRTFNTAYTIEDREFGQGRPNIYFHNFLIPYLPSDMVEWTARGNKNPYERNIYIDWYNVVDGVRGEKADSLLFYDRLEGYPGNIFVQAEGPSEIGDYELVITYKGVEVINQFFSILEPVNPQGKHSYEFLGDLSKEYDGEPVEFDPYDSKTFLIDDGNMSWGALDKYGEARYVWRVFTESGKVSAWIPMDEGEVPTAVGRYQLVIQEMGEKDWEDAAVFEFEITGSPATIYIHSASAVLEGLIKLKYYYEIPDGLMSQDDAAIVFYKDGEEAARTPLYDGVYIDLGENAGQWAYYFDVVAAEIGTPITAQILDGSGNPVTVLSVNGTDYTDGFTFSVQDYAEYMQEAGSEEMKPLAKALKDYGIAAKLYFENGDTTGLAVSAETQAVTEADLEQYALSTSGTKPAGFAGCSISVVFEADNSLRIYFKFDGSKSPENYSYTLDGSPAALHERSDGAKYLTVENIPAGSLAEPHSFSISDGTDTYTVTASALSYALTSIINGNEARQNLGKALYLYNKAAAAYFAE
jgi:hypothetical protein